jgi:predicted nucleic acid-binding Zn ribbon protein
VSRPDTPGVPAVPDPEGADAGGPDPSVPEREASPDGIEDDPDAALVALNRVRQAAEARGEARRRRPGAGTRSGSAAGTAGQGRRRGPAGPDTRDPRMVGDVFGRLVTERGWSSPVAVGSVLSRWDELVGADIALHCRPESFENAVVTVRCDSTAWATQLKLLSPALLQRFEQALGPGIVTTLRVAGPAAPSWRKGPRVVKGRGPRDTYG